MLSSSVRFQFVKIRFKTFKTFSRTFSSADEFKVIVVGGGHAGKIIKLIKNIFL